jgi:hypothetical protein
MPSTKTTFSPDIGVNCSFDAVQVDRDAYRRAGQMISREESLASTEWPGVKSATSDPWIVSQIALASRRPVESGSRAV